MRYRDVSLIAVGKFVYISDDRFRVMHEPNADDWFLVIKSVSYKDEGIYECQVNSEPYLTYKYSLSVVGKWTIYSKGPFINDVTHFGRILDPLFPLCHTVLHNDEPPKLTTCRRLVAESLTPPPLLYDLIHECSQRGYF